MNTREPAANSSAAFKPRLDILSPPQQRLWLELSETPEEFTLVDATAIALRLGHRPSVDFDFFASTPLVARALLQKVPYLKGATVRQSAPNTLTVTVERGDLSKCRSSVASTSGRSHRQRLLLGLLECDDRALSRATHAATPYSVEFVRSLALAASRNACSKPSISFADHRPRPERRPALKTPSQR